MFKNNAFFSKCMEIFMERTQQTMSRSFSGVASDLLSNLGIGSEEVLIIRNGELVTEDELLTNEDSIKLLSVISGG